MIDTDDRAGPSAIDQWGDDDPIFVGSSTESAWRQSRAPFCKNDRYSKKFKGAMYAAPLTYARQAERWFPAVEWTLLNRASGREARRKRHRLQLPLAPGRS